MLRATRRTAAQDNAITRCKKNGVVVKAAHNAQMHAVSAVSSELEKCRERSSRRLDAKHYWNHTAPYTTRTCSCCCWCCCDCCRPWLDWNSHSRRQIGHEFFDVSHCEMHCRWNAWPHFPHTTCAIANHRRARLRKVPYRCTVTRVLDTWRAALEGHLADSADIPVEVIAPRPSCDGIPLFNVNLESHSGHEHNCMTAKLTPDSCHLVCRSRPP